VVSVAQKIRVTCAVNLRFFPYDNQTCEITYQIPFPRETYALIPDTRDFFQPHLVFEPNTEWTDVTTEMTLVHFDVSTSGATSEHHSTLKVMISMKRLPNFYIVYLIIPSVLTSMVTVLVFWLPAESGERIGLSITSLLSYTVFLLMVSDVSPRGGQNLSIICEYHVQLR